MQSHCFVAIYIIFMDDIGYLSYALRNSKLRVQSGASVMVRNEQIKITGYEERSAVVPSWNEDKKYCV